MSREGEIIYMDEGEDRVDLAFASSIFTDTFYTLNGATIDIGLSDLIRLEVETEDGAVFLIYRSGTHSIFTIFNSEGNISLARIILSKALKRI